MQMGVGHKPHCQSEDLLPLCLSGQNDFKKKL